MIAVDTNILVRLLTADDLRQTPKAQQLFDSESIYLPKTVLRETAWVLEELYHFDRATVLQAFIKLVDFPDTTCEGDGQVRRALDWALGGMDLPDAMHLASSHRCERFATFDRAFLKAARKADTTPPVAAP